MSKHTPGPWILDTNYNEQNFAVVSSANRKPFGGDWHALARVVITLDGEPSAEGQANARLIAASPAMYEALFKMVVAFAPWDCPTVKQDEALRAAKAALASADGEAR